jgi:hypothetical protein
MGQGKSGTVHPMQLVGLSFQNYKAFHGRESLELRPLTVLIGRNSSGKSAIARLPLLLAGALSDRAESPLELDVEGVDFGASFLDLIHNRKPHGSVGLGATFDQNGERIELWAKVQHYDDVKVQVVAELELKTPDLGRLSFTRIGSDPLEEPPRYRVELPLLEPRELSLPFRGILPNLTSALLTLERSEATLEVSALERITPLYLALRTYLDTIGYLGPFREAPRRQYRYPGGLPQSVGKNGVQAPALLGTDALRKGGVVVKAVSEWYKEHLGHWALDVVSRGDTFSLILRSPDDNKVEVNLADAGTGLNQVLPLIVQRHFEQLTGKGGGLEIVEQPELHLHPGAHGDLADLYIEAAKQPGASFIIETHSENFILRIRRRIAEHHRHPEKGLNPDLLRLYWIDDEPRPGSHVKPIEVLPNGDVINWPEGVFSEDFEEVCAIREAQGMEAP